MARVLVHDYLRAPAAAMSDDVGRRIRAAIEKALKTSDSVALDFSGVRITTPIFFHAALSSFYETYGKEGAERRIKIEHAAPNVERSIAASIWTIMDFIENPELAQIEAEVMLAEDEDEIEALRQALFDGEQSGEAGEMDMDTVKRKARRRAIQST